MTTTQERPILQRRISHAKDWALSIPAHYSALRASPHTTDHISYRRTEETFITLFRRTKLFSLARHAWMIITSTRTGRFSIGEYLRRKDVPYLQKQVVHDCRAQQSDIRSSSMATVRLLTIARRIVHPAIIRSAQAYYGRVGLATTIGVSHWIVT